MLLRSKAIFEAMYFTLVSSIMYNIDACAMNKFNEIRMKLARDNFAFLGIRKCTIAHHNIVAGTFIWRALSCWLYGTQPYVSCACGVFRT